MNTVRFFGARTLEARRNLLIAILNSLDGQISDACCDVIFARREDGPQSEIYKTAKKHLDKIHPSPNFKADMAIWYSRVNNYLSFDKNAGRTTKADTTDDRHALVDFSLSLSGLDCRSGCFIGNRGSVDRVDNSQRHTVSNADVTMYPANLMLSNTYAFKSDEAFVEVMQEEGSAWLASLPAHTPASRTKTLYARHLFRTFLQDCHTMLVTGKFGDGRFPDALDVPEVDWTTFTTTKKIPFMTVGEALDDVWADSRTVRSSIYVMSNFADVASAE